MGYYSNFRRLGGLQIIIGSHSAAKLPTMVTIFGNITLNKCFPVNGYFIGFGHVISTGN